MIFYCGFKQYIFNAENQVERIMQKLICKGGLQPQEEMEKMLIVLIGVFQIIILKLVCHIDDGTVKAIIEVYNFWAGYYLCKLKWCINKYVLIG